MHWCGVYKLSEVVGSLFDTTDHYLNFGVSPLFVLELYPSKGSLNVSMIG